MATINRLKGLVPIKTLISYTSSSFHFPMIISSILTVDQRLLTHLGKGKTSLLKGSPAFFPSWQFCEEAQEEFSLLSPFWEISCVLIPYLLSLHSAVRSKLQNFLFVVWEKNWKFRLPSTDARKIRVLDCILLGWNIVLKLCKYSEYSILSQLIPQENLLIYSTEMVPTLVKPQCESIGQQPGFSRSVLCALAGDYYKAPSRV